MHRHFLALTLGSLLFTGSAVASPDTVLPLAQKSACMACHALDTKMVGPAYKDVAAKYKNDKSAEARLVAKVKDGGKGVWGAIPMPPNPSVKDADIQVLVHWILTRPY